LKYPKDHISYSAFSKFEECARRWWFDYVRYPQEKVDIPAFVMGNAYHSAMAAMYKGEPVEECENIYLRELTKGIPVGLKNSENLRLAIRYYYSNIYPEYRSKVESVESEKTINLPDLDIPFMYKMDLVTVDGFLIDHKTVGGRAPSINFNDQLNLYSVAHMVSNGRLPRATQLHLAYKGNHKGDAVEVKSTVPVLSEVLSTLSRLRAMVRMVKGNSFPARRGRHCNYCPYKNECDALLIDSNGSDII